MIICFTVISVEMISAVQALNFRKGKLGRGTQLAYNVIKDIFPGINKDENLITICRKNKRDCK